MFSLHKDKAVTSAAVESAPVQEAQPWGDIYTMPTAFRPSGSAVHASTYKSQRWLWVGIGVVLVVILGAATYLYLNQRSTPPPAPPPAVVEPVTPNPEPPPVITPTPPVTTPVERDRTRYRDVRNIQTALELYRADNNTYPVSSSPVVLGTSTSSALSSIGFSVASQGAVYLERVPQNPDPGGIPYQYQSADGSTYVISFSLESGTAGLLLGEHKASPQGFDGVSQLPVNPPPTVRPVQPPPLGVDSDVDGLSDVEEAVLGTDTKKPDTDGDSYLDGAEVLAGYDPTQGGGALLRNSTQLTTYTNEHFGYEVRIPKDWTTRSAADDESEVIISGGGEFFEVVVVPNPQHLSAQEWYSKQVPGVTAAEVPTEVLGSATWAVAINGLARYLATDNYIYTVSYNIGTNIEASLYNLYRVFWQSFTLSPAVTPPPATTPEPGIPKS